MSEAASITAEFKKEEKRKALKAYEAAVAKAKAVLKRRLARIPQSVAAFSKRQQKIDARQALQERNQRICDLYDGGKSYAEISSELGLSRAHVQGLARRSQRAEERRLAAKAYDEERKRVRNFAKLADDARYAVVEVCDYLGVEADKMTPELIAGLSAIEASRIPHMSHDMLFALKYLLDENGLQFKPDPAPVHPALLRPTPSAPSPTPVG
jgi:DNA-binding CsgD family transcriptional regulator